MLSRTVLNHAKSLPSLSLRTAKPRCPQRAAIRESLKGAIRIASAESNPEPSRSTTQPADRPISTSSPQPAADTPTPDVPRTETNDDASTSASTASGPTSSQTGLLASVGVIGGIVALAVCGYVFRDQIRQFLEFFITAVEDWGPWGYVAYALVYTGLEVLAVPAIPLTMTAGAIFGPIAGTGMVAVSATMAATIAFLLARYALRDRVQKMAQGNANFAAIDRAIGKDGLKFVTLLRLSPLLPLAASNYLYGLTSVDLPSYVLGSFLGMLPGTYAYVTAGHFGKAVLMNGEGSLGVETWQVALGVSTTVLALGYIGQLAKKAVEEAKAEGEQ